MSNAHAQTALDFDRRAHLAMGEKLRDAGLDAVEANNPTWVKEARREARVIAEDGGLVTTDDLRRWADRTRQQPVSPHAWGSVFAPKEWVCVGRKKSDYAPNHAREIRVWRWAP